MSTITYTTVQGRKVSECKQATVVVVLAVLIVEVGVQCTHLHVICVEVAPGEAAVDAALRTVRAGQALA